MAKKASKAAPVPVAAINLTGPLEQAVRDVRTGTWWRGNLSKLIGAQEVQKVADSDPDLATQLAGVAKTIADQDQAAISWQTDLAAAVEWWDACLGDFAARHRDAVGEGGDTRGG